MNRFDNTRARRWRHIPAAAGALVALLALLIALPGDAQAGRKAKPHSLKRHAEKAVPLRHAPRLEFLTGTLSRDAAGGWSLDGRRLQLREGFLVVGGGEDGRAGEPVSGLRVLLSGIRTAKGFQAQSGVALKPAPPDAPRGEGARTVTWSDVDGRVGVGSGPGRS